MTHVTCSLAAKNQDQLRNPTLGDRIRATFTFFTVCKSAQDKDVKLPVYLMIRRGKTTYFVDVFENTKVVDLKKMLECLTRQLAGDMRLFRENEQVTDDSNYK